MIKSEFPITPITSYQSKQYENRHSSTKIIMYKKVRSTIKVIDNPVDHCHYQKAMCPKCLGQIISIHSVDSSLSAKYKGKWQIFYYVIKFMISLQSRCTTYISSK